MLDYGDIQFDAKVFAEEIKNLIEMNTMGKNTRERIVDQMHKGVHAKTLFSETQKIFLICSTNLLIHSSARYLVTILLPNIVKEMKETAAAQGKELDDKNPDVLNEITRLILAQEDTINRLDTMVSNVLKVSAEVLNEMPQDQIEIDKLYGLPTGTCANIALDLFVAMTSEDELFRTYTHIVIIDDVYGHYTPLQLDPKVVTFTKTEIKNTEEEGEINE